MTIFTTYAIQKFDLLNKHKVYIREEQIEEVINAPTALKKRGKLMFAYSETIGVVYQVEGEIKRVLTFYPLGN